MVTTSLFAQKDKIYTKLDGLSNSIISGFTQDKNGVIWIATNRGVNKFDGYNFEVFVNDPLDTNSIQANVVQCVFHHSDGIVFAGTTVGLYTYSPVKNNFVRYPLYYQGKNISTKILSIKEDFQKNLWIASSLGLIYINLKTNTIDFKNPLAAQKENVKIDPINIIQLDNAGNIWIGTDGYGLKYFNTKTNEIVYFKNNAKSSGIRDNIILSLLVDSKGNVIVGTIKGITVFQPKKNKFIQVPNSHTSGTKSQAGIYSLVEDKKGNIWVGTERNGVKILDTETFLLKDANPSIKMEGVNDSKVFCFEDKDENLWFGIEHKGIYLKKEITKSFHSIRKNSSTLSLSNEIVKTIFQDSYRNLWIGTDGGGLNLLPPGKKNIKVYRHDPSEINSVSDNAIITLFEDKHQNLWVGSYLGGLSLYDRKKETFTNYLNDTTKEGSNYNYFTSIISAGDGSNKFWIGTMALSLYEFDPDMRTFINHQKIYIDGSWIELPKFINTLYLDKEENLWIGSYNGLFCWNRKKGIYHSFTKKNKKINTDEIFDILQDSNNDIWVGSSSGIYQIDAKSLQMTHYSEVDGLSSNKVSGILEDHKSNLWISTENGLSKFNKEEKSFRNYYVQDGLPGNEFSSASRFKRKDGMLYFGSASGLVYFHPDSIKESKTFPTLVLSKVKLFNKEVEVGKKKNGHVILNKPLMNAENIQLRYSDNSFTIEFAAVDFNVPEKIKYSYQMEGFDDDWTTKNYNERSATYTNLNPGTYTFKIKSTNSDGIWNEHYKKILVLISPPWWQTWWARIGYFLFILAILYFARRLTLLRWEMRNALRLERMEREKQEEITQSKLLFFTNISHEFRTPLTLILAPIDKLLNEQKNPGILRQIKLIHSNALRMLRMFNQLLELQKVEENKMELNAQPDDIIAFIQNIAEPFEELLMEKGIDFSIKFPVGPLVIWFDSDKIDKVIFNLLSNAYKFTPEKGKIGLEVRKIKDEEDNTAYVEIIIEDTGIGLKKEHHTKIFERFYQIENKNIKTSNGTGIGLHLVKSLVELHNGEINVLSEEGRGSTFIVKLPINYENRRNVPLPSNILPDQVTHIKEEIEKEEDLEEVISIREEDISPNRSNYKVLVIDDDKHILNFLKSELSEHYIVLEATNGKEGLRIAQIELPDLVISDIMMPEMDGIELCKKVKTDIHTCHIPVILLTAKSSIENRIEGLETGADSYIPKPFHLNHLKTRIQKLIELRENLKRKFSRSLNFEVKEMTIMSADEKFLQKAIDFVKERISDSELNVEEMGKQMGMSRAQLYRKLKSLTDQSPSEFVRTIRLKQAAYLLSTNKLNISEVAYKVGFNSPQYFTNSFRDYFQMSPTEYCQKFK